MEVPWSHGNRGCERDLISTFLQGSLISKHGRYRIVEGKSYAHFCRTGMSRELSCASQQLRCIRRDHRCLSTYLGWVGLTHADSLAMHYSVDVLQGFVCCVLGVRCGVLHLLFASNLIAFCDLRIGARGTFWSYFRCWGEGRSSRTSFALTPAAALHTPPPPNP